ncbi:hypothetical protein L211DRAFT_536952 [Terfezia boudieri ATCC MYA-4762]|uniref:Telomerase reverse transcriptase n=1 Tax=Terfezia boudieri ATCC MYA-4762 TaxID=1051890 RepID=A0A3N4LWV3_9PEZI|nr:hypothetical protein L211DRAFT_536952 [Terfezia boudieri ATCC MYA-4762]
MAKMAKRRRSAELQRDAEPPKKRRKEAHLPRQPEKAGHHVLSVYFPTLLTLRQYLVARLSSLRRSQAQDRGFVELQSDRIQGSHPLRSLLDTTLVGLDGEVPKGNQITHDMVEATASSPLWSAGEGPPQSEIVQVAIRILFARRTSFFPTNILTGGYKFKNGDIVCSIPNTHVQTLKSPLWQQLLKLIREAVMLDLLLTTSVFIFTKNDCFYQLIGNPISEGVPTQLATHIGGQGLNHDARQAVGQSIKRPTSDASKRDAKRQKFTDSAAASLSRINFARLKMFSRPTINSRGDVTFGFRHNFSQRRKMYMYCITSFPSNAAYQMFLHQG